MRLGNFLTELKRRNVYRVAAAYCVVGWLVIQIVTQVFPFFDVPDWGVRLVVLAVALGLPFAVAFAWVYEITPEGVKRTEDVPRQSAARQTGRRLDVLIITVLAAVIALLVIDRSRSPRQPERNSTDKSIVVLPFQNASENAGAEYLAEGISEALINSLAEVQQLRVIARATAFQYKGREIDPVRVGRELNVGVVLTGKVRQLQDALSVQVDLVDASTGAQLWGAGYDRKISDLITVKQSITQEVTEKLKLRLSGDEQRRLVKRDTANPEAYQLYLKGRYFWNKRTQAGLQEGIAFFRQAIEADPAYALAHVGLADSYNFLGAFGIALLPPGEAMPKARAAALKALETDDALAEAHASLAFVKLYYDWDWTGAETAFQRAISLNPNYAPAHQWYSHLLMSSGRTGDAILHAKRASDIDPLSLPAAMNVGWQYYWSRQYDDAVAQLRRVLEMDPKFEQAHWALGLAYEGKCNADEAASEFRRAIELSRGTPIYLAALGHAQASGNKDAALQISRELQEQSRSTYVSPYWMAALYAALPDHDRAFAALEQALEERSGGAVWLAIDPAMDPLRSDPRFAVLLQRIRLKP